MRALSGHHVLRALECVSAPIWILDGAGLVVWTNDAARRLLGEQGDAIAGQSFSRLLEGSSSSRLQSAIARVVAGELASADVLVSTSLGSKNGTSASSFELEVSVAPVQLDGLVAGVVAVGVAHVTARRDRQDFA